MSTETELLRGILTNAGGDVNSLPDNLHSTLYEAIITACGGSVKDLPNRLKSTYLKRIAECLGGNVDNLPDNLHSTLYEAIITAGGGSVADLPDRLTSTYLQRIAECISGGGKQYAWSEDLITNQTDLSGATIKFNTEATIESLDVISWKLFISDAGYYLYCDAYYSLLRLHDKNGNIIETIYNSSEGWRKDSVTLPSDFGYITQFGSLVMDTATSFSLNILNTIAPNGISMP